MSNITGCALSRLRFAITGCALSRLRFAITGCALLRFAPWLTVIAILSASTVFAQAPKPAAQVKPAAKAAPVDRAWTPPRTPWGDPDLQGVWNNATSTPLERPDRVGAKTVLSDEEAGEFQQELANQLSRDRRDGPAEADVARAYNEHWMDSRRLKIADRRTSLIVDPPDGHIPALVPPSPERSKAKAAKAASNTRFNAGMPDTYRDFTLPVRCIIRTDSPPYLPIVYNNDLQILQGPGYVAIAPEMIHSARIIPLDGRPHLGKNLHQWLGDTRGHWEGNTLVVETTNFRHDDGVVFQDANPETFKLVERFTRVGPDTVNYEFTVSDPTTWTRPWTAMLPWTKIDPKEQMYEYACHEDNYDEVHFLAGARAREKKGETK